MSITVTPAVRIAGDGEPPVAEPARLEPPAVVRCRHTVVAHGHRPQAHLRNRPPGRRHEGALPARGRGQRGAPFDAPQRDAAHVTVGVGHDQLRRSRAHQHGQPLGRARHRRRVWREGQVAAADHRLGDRVGHEYAARLVHPDDPPRTQPRDRLDGDGAAHPAGDPHRLDVDDADAAAAGRARAAHPERELRAVGREAPVLVVLAELQPRPARAERARREPREDLRPTVDAREDTDRLPGACGLGVAPAGSNDHGRRDQQCKRASHASARRSYVRTRT